jgi:hypothetical protein
MQKSRISHQAKNGRKLEASAMQKADAPEMPVHWLVFEGVPPKRKVHFPRNAGQPVGQPG